MPLQGEVCPPVPWPGAAGGRQQGEGRGGGRAVPPLSAQQGPGVPHPVQGGSVPNPGEVEEEDQELNTLCRTIKTSKFVPRMHASDTNFIDI